MLVVALVTFLVSGTQYSWSLRGGYCGDQTTAISRAEVEEIVDNFLKRLKGTEYISADQTYDTKKAFSEIEKFMAQLDREHAQLSGHENQAALRISVLQRVLDVIDEQHMMIDFADEFGEGVAWNFTMGRTPEGHLIAYGHRGHFVAINAENGIYT